MRHNYDIEIGTSDKPQRIFKITPTTHYVRRENILVDIECYYYGTLTDAGGKDKVNIHLDTKDAGSLTIRTDKEYLAGYQCNPLYIFIRLLNEEDDLHENAMGISDILMSLKTSLDKDFINFANKTQR